MYGDEIKNAPRYSQLMSGAKCSPETDNFPWHGCISQAASFSLIPTFFQLYFALDQHIVPSEVED